MQSQMLSNLSHCIAIVFTGYANHTIAFRFEAYIELRENGRNVRPSGKPLNTRHLAETARALIV
jgi:hypothetical protein